jgi:hypothetical protein
MTLALREHLKKAVRKMRERRAERELAAQQRELAWRQKLLFGSF